MIIKKQLTIYILSCLLPLFLLSTAHASETEPGKIVQKTVNQVLDILGDSQMAEEDKRAKISDTVAQHINFKGMSRRIVALNWKKASDEQKQQFEESFKQILLDTYWQRIKNYSGQSVEYITGMIEGHNIATIDTIIISDKIEIPITYRMELVDGKWLAYDFLIESLSLVTNYRTEYRNIIKLHGIDGLLEHMQKEIAK